MQCDSLLPGEEFDLVCKLLGDVRISLIGVDPGLHLPEVEVVLLLERLHDWVQVVVAGAGVADHCLLFWRELVELLTELSGLLALLALFVLELGGSLLEIASGHLGIWLLLRWAVQRRILLIRFLCLGGKLCSRTRLYLITLLLLR